MTTIKYKIIEVHAQEHSVVVRYYTDVVTEQSLAVQSLPDGTIQRCRTDYNLLLPIPAPSGQALEDFILARAPAQWLSTMEAIQTPTPGTSLSTISALLNIEQAAGTPPTAYATPLDQQKAALSARVDKRRSAILASGVSYMGHQFDSDPASVALVTSVVSAFSAGVPLPTGFTWRSAANNNVPITGAQLCGLLATMIDTANTIFNVSWAKKQQIANATTPEQLALVTWADAATGGEL